MGWVPFSLSWRFFSLCFALRLFGRDDQRRRFFVGDLSLRDQHIKRLLFADLGLDLVDAVVLLQLGAQLLRVLVAGGGQLGDALLHVGVADRDAFALGDRLDQDRAARLLLGLAAASPRASSRRRTLSTSMPAIIELLLGAVDDQLRVALDQRGRDRELVALDQLLDQRARHLSLDAPLVRLEQPLAHLLRSPSSVSASPVSLAISSSSAGTFFSRASLMVTCRCTSLPASLGGGLLGRHACT